MGVVYEARDLERDATVALKTVRRASPSAMARFKREFRALADLVHPNLVALYELIADDDNLFFSMELIEGEHFHRWVRMRSIDPDGQSEQPTYTMPDSETRPTMRSGPSRIQRDGGILDVRRLRGGLRQLAEGIAAIHRAGLLHRDIKPSNVVVTPQERVVILDFGLATHLSDESARTTEERPLEGTVAFMSPEQCARNPLTPASDWYSVGVMLFLALTGRMPFVGGNDDVLMDKQRFEPPPAIELERDVPPDLSALASELLRTDPKRRPTGDEVLRRLGSDAVGGGATASIRSSHTSGSVLVGRERELGVLSDALVAARDGNAIMVQVSGRSGVGKSRVVHGFLADIGPNALVLHGRCYEHELVPFKAVDSLIDALAQHLTTLRAIDIEGLMPRDAQALARVFPVLRQVDAFTSRRRRTMALPDPQELRRRVFVALRELLTRLADRQPLVLAVDDLQWGDADSASLLAALLRPPEAPPMLVIGSYRSEDTGTGAFLPAFDRHTRELGVGVRSLELDALSHAQAREMAALHLAGQTDVNEHAEWIATESGGNPLFVEELARHVRADGAGKPGWASLDEALRGRVDRLPDDAGRLLSVIAVAGRPVSQSVAMRAAEVSDPAIMSLLRAGSFVRTRLSGDHRLVESYHDRIRETTVGMLDDTRVQQHHLRLARALEGTAKPDPEALAVHYYAAGDLLRAAEFAVRAAEHASHILAFDRAAHFYQMALETDPQNRELVIKLAEALSNAGRGRDAADAYLTAVEQTTKGADILDLRTRAAWQLLASGHIDRGLEAVQQVLDALKLKYPATPRSALFSVLWGRLRLGVRGLRFKEIDEREVPASKLAQIDALFAAAQLLGMAEAVRSADFHVRSLRLALDVGEPKRVARALVGEAVFTSLPGIKTAKRADTILKRVNAMCDELDDPPTRGLTHGAEAMTAFNLGRFSSALDHALEAERIFREECTGYHWEVSTAQLFQGFALALLGRVSDMTARFPALVKEANERGNLYAATSFRACLGFYVPLAYDDPQMAYDEVDDAMNRWSAMGYHLQHANALSSRMCIDLYRGDGTAALERSRQEWPELRRSLLLRTQIIRVMLWGARGRAAICAHERGAPKDVLKMASKAQRILSREGVAYAEGMGAGLRAGLAMCRGDKDAAMMELDKAIELTRQGEILIVTMPLVRARGLLVGGDEGAAQVAEVDEFFTSQSLTNPARVAAIFAPGFGQAL